MIWSFKKEKKDVEKLEAEVRELKEEVVEIKKQRPQVDKLVTELHKHLQENNFGTRLYLSMIDSRR
jgi:chromosome segregation ATPase